MLLTKVIVHTAEGLVYEFNTSQVIDVQFDEKPIVHTSHSGQQVIDPHRSIKTLTVVFDISEASMTQSPADFLQLKGED